MAGEVITVRIDAIRIDGETQMRERNDDGTVEEYAEAYRNATAMPPLEVVFDGEDYWVWDGFHRHHAALRAGLAELPVNARWLACGANRTHGLKRTNEDKRRAVRAALAARPEMSDKAIAGHCGVSQPFVGSIRASYNGYKIASERTVTRGGTTYTQDTSNIGSASRPALDPWDEDDEEGDPADPPEVPANPTPPEPAGAKAEAKVIPPPATDGWGIPIQPHAAEAFAATGKFKELIAAIRQAQKLFNEVASLPGGKFLQLPANSSYKRGKADDPGRFVNSGLERASEQVKNAIPSHTVCPYQYAESPHPDECHTCGGMNWTPALNKSIPPSCVEKAKEAFGVKGVE